MEKEVKKIKRETNVVITDTETGEVKKMINTTTAYVNREPDYIKLYIADIVKLHDLSNSTNSILMNILAYMRYDNSIALGSYEKTAICEKLKVQLVTVNHCIRALCSKGILTRQAQGRYLVNPYLFGKGSWEDIKSIRLTVRYDENGRFIVAEINNPEKADIKTIDEQINKII